MSSSSEGSSRKTLLSIPKPGEGTQESIGYDDVISTEEKEPDDKTNVSEAPSEESSLSSQSFTSSCCSYASNKTETEDGFQLDSFEMAADSEDEAEQFDANEEDTANEDEEEVSSATLTELQSEDTSSPSEGDMEDEMPQSGLNTPPLVDDSNENVDLAAISDDEGDPETLSKAFSIGVSLSTANFEEESESDEASPAIGSSDDEVASEEEIDEEKKEQVNLDQGVDVEAVIQSDTVPARSASSTDLSQDNQSRYSAKQVEERANLNAEAFFNSAETVPERREPASDMYYEHLDANQAKSLQVPATTSSRSAGGGSGDPRSYTSTMLPSPPVKRSKGEPSAPEPSEFQHPFLPSYVPACPPFDPTDPAQWKFWQWAMNGAPWTQSAHQSHYGPPFTQQQQYSGPNGQRAYQVSAPMMPPPASAGGPPFDNRVRSSVYRPPAGPGQAPPQQNRPQYAPYPSAVDSEEDARGQYPPQGGGGRGYGSRGLYRGNNQRGNAPQQQPRGFTPPHLSQRSSSETSNVRSFRKDYHTANMANAGPSSCYPNQKVPFYPGGSNQYSHHQQPGTGGYSSNNSASTQGAYKRGRVTNDRPARSYFNGAHEQAGSAYGRDRGGGGRVSQQVADPTADQFSFNDGSSSGTAIRQLGGGNDEWFEFTDGSSTLAPQRGRGGGGYRSDYRPSGGGGGGARGSDRSDNFNNNRGSDYRGPTRGSGYRGGGTAGYRGGAGAYNQERFY